MACLFYFVKLHNFSFVPHLLWFGFSKLWLYFTVLVSKTVTMPEITTNLVFGFHNVWNMITFIHDDLFSLSSVVIYWNKRIIYCLVTVRASFWAFCTVWFWCFALFLCRNNLYFLIINYIEFTFFKKIFCNGLKFCKANIHWLLYFVVVWKTFWKLRISSL